MYTYCFNDPIQYVDPTGHITDWEKDFYEGKQGSASEYTTGGMRKSEGHVLSNETVSTWSAESKKATFTTNGITQTMYVEKDGNAYNSDGNVVGKMVGGHISVTDSVYNALFGSGSGGTSNVTIDVRKGDHVTSVTTPNGSNVTINNRSIIDTITTGKSSSLFLNNSGKINSINIGEGSTATINDSGSIGSISTNDTSNPDFINAMSTQPVFTETGNGWENITDGSIETGDPNVVLVSTGKTNDTRIKNQKNEYKMVSKDGKKIQWVPEKDILQQNYLISKEYSYCYSKGPRKTVVPASDVSYTTFDISKAPLGVQKELIRLYAQLKTIQEQHGLYSMGMKLQNEDDAIESTLSLIEGQINFASSDLGKVVGRIQSAGAGTIQFVGGITETMTGTAIFTGTSWTGVGIPIGLSGGYMALDGASNATGGASKVYNAVFGNNEGDTLNFMKVAYKKISPEYGESIYNLTQLGIGLYCVGRGLKELPSNSTKVYARSKNITRAQSEGLAVSTNVLDVNNQLVVTTKTKSGMILQRTIIDKSKLKSGALFIGVDAKNTKDANDALH